MNRAPFLAASLVLGMLATPALAQTYEGNWECLNGPEAAGILTIYLPSYGFASQTFGDPLSGTGAAQGFSDGLQFTDGNLVSKGNIVAGRLVDVGGQSIMQLESQSGIVMTCVPRRAYTGGMFGQPSAPPPAGLSTTPNAAPETAPIPAGPRPN